MREELGVHILGRGVLSPGDVGLSDSVYFSPPKQAVSPSEPNFWTHYLQIHCNGLGNRNPIIGAICGKVARAMMSAMAC